MQSSSKDFGRLPSLVICPRGRKQNLSSEESLTWRTLLHASTVDAMTMSLAIYGQHCDSGRELALHPFEAFDAWVNFIFWLCQWSCLKRFFIFRPAQQTQLDTRSESQLKSPLQHMARLRQSCTNLLSLISWTSFRRKQWNLLDFQITFYKLDKNHLLLILLVSARAPRPFAVFMYNARREILYLLYTSCWRKCHLCLFSAVLQLSSSGVYIRLWWHAVAREQYPACRLSFSLPLPQSAQWRAHQQAKERVALISPYLASLIISLSTFFPWTLVLTV